MQISNSYSNVSYQPRFTGNRTTAINNALKTLGRTAPSRDVAISASQESGEVVSKHQVRKVRSQDSIKPVRQEPEYDDIPSDHEEQGDSFQLISHHSQPPSRKPAASSNAQHRRNAKRAARQGYAWHTISNPSGTLKNVPPGIDYDSDVYYERKPIPKRPKN